LNFNFFSASFCMIVLLLHVSAPRCHHQGIFSVTKACRSNKNFRCYLPKLP
jgi:hypothetical protein